MSTTLLADCSATPRPADRLEAARRTTHEDGAVSLPDTADLNLKTVSARWTGNVRPVDPATGREVLSPCLWDLQSAAPAPRNPWEVTRKDGKNLSYPAMRPRPLLARGLSIGAVSHRLNARRAVVDSS